MSLHNLKGKRTRFKNSLQENLIAGQKLLAVQTGAIDLESFLEEIEKIINNLKHFSDKLDTACAELSLCAANEEYVQFIEEDNLIQTEAFNCVSELELRRKSIKEKYMEPALEDQVIQLQTQVQQLMTDQ